jgi:hypothetical protein
MMLPKSALVGVKVSAAAAGAAEAAMAQNIATSVNARKFVPDRTIAL